MTLSQPSPSSEKLKEADFHRSGEWVNWGLSSGDLFGLMAIGVLKAKVPVEEEGAEIAQNTVQSLVCLPWVECPGQEGEGNVRVRVLVGWTDPD